MDFEKRELKGFCSIHDWQPMSFEEQGAMIGGIERRQDSLSKNTL